MKEKEDIELEALQKRVSKLQKEQAVRDMESQLSRAHSVTVGTCFGGTTEITMRAHGSHLWCIMQPVEVIELIHQLAANVGCHINIKPRADFSSWRDWKSDGALEYNGVSQDSIGASSPPQVNDMAPHQIKGKTLPSPDQQPELKIPKEIKNDTIMATKKIVNQRSTKRASKIT